MPLLTLEYTSNLNAHFNPRDFLLNSHVKIAKQIDTKLENCKSRVIMHDNFVMGSGGDEKAFVILTVEILQGRDFDIRSKLADDLLGYLHGTFYDDNLDLVVQLSVQIKELSGVYASGTFELS